MNPPPPMPHEYGSVTPSTAAAATAASTALPPRAQGRRSRPAVAAGRRWRPRRPCPSAVGCFCWASATAGSKSTSAIAAAIRRRMKTIAVAVPGLAPPDAMSPGACRRTNCSTRSGEAPNRGTSTRRSMPSRPYASTVSASMLTARAHRQLEIGDVPPRVCEVAAEALDLLFGLGQGRAGSRTSRRRSGRRGGGRLGCGRRSRPEADAGSAGDGRSRPRSARTRPRRTAAPAPRARASLPGTRPPASRGAPSARPPPSSRARGNRPPSRRSGAHPSSESRLASCFARTTGLRCGRITIPVASRMRVVRAAANASATSGSSIGPSGSIGDGPAHGSGTTTCSPIHSES